MRHRGSYIACRDCDHYGKGYSVKTHFYKQNVCFAKPKKGNMEGYFYCTEASKAACDLYKPKENKI